MNINKQHLKSIFIIFFLLTFSWFLQAETEEAVSSKGILSAKDTLRINRVGSPALSPDNQWVLYTKTVRDMEDKDLKAVTHIWRVKTDGSRARQITFGENNCTSPAWFPCGKKFAFLSSRGKGDENSDGGPKTQVFIMYIDGGEAWQLTEHSEGIQSFQISPDGKSLVFTARDPLSEEEKEKKKLKDDAEVVDQDFRMSHLWHFDIEGKKEERLTEGEFTVSDPQWSPDSKQVAFVTRPTPKVDDNWRSDIWAFNLEAKEKKLLYENPGPDSNPRWSPDGKLIAFSSHPHSRTSTWHQKLYLIEPEDGEPRILLEDFDRDFGTPMWSPEGKTIYWATGDKTSINLFSVDIESGQVDSMNPPIGANFQWELAKDGKKWTWVHSPSDWPAEIFSSDIGFESPVRLSDTNPWVCEEKIKFGQVKLIKWKNSDDQWIEGVLTLPVDFKEGEKYPLILNPHGGPSGAVIQSFNATNQFFAGNSFMVLQPNFRGSSNYGQEFLNSNRNQWGFRDYDDCMTGVDYCLEQGWADPEKLVCYGWSYGGYMSFWIVTQTDRFKAVSPGAGLPNLLSMYSTTDIPGYMRWFFETPWGNEEKYLRHSPLHYVKQVKTPVLIMHGANDARVPPTQAVEFYQALKDLEKEVTFIRYPREGHGIREPRHHIDRLKRYLFFFCRHTGVTPVSDKPENKEKKAVQ